jgi:hypothetical protein
MLTNKYLKYSPEITLEIFKLVWDALIADGWSSVICVDAEEQFDKFKSAGFLIYENEGKNNFSHHSLYSINNKDKETTVQEILGYNPFKDDFVLPEKWFIKTSKNDEGRLIGEWFDKQSDNNCYHKGCLGEYYHSHNNTGQNILVKGNLSASFANTSVVNGHVEISFNEFQKYVLKTTEQPKVMEKDWGKASKEELLEEAKHRYPIGCTIKSAYDTSFKKTIDSDVFMIGFNEDVCCGSINGVSVYNKKHNRWAKIISLPETKVESKSIEKWSVGSYVVFLKNLDSMRIVGFIDKIISKDRECVYLKLSKSCAYSRENKGQIKWFSTKSEAEEFAKTLLSPIEDTIECETCNGEGQVMVGKLYPSGHTEVNETCPDCNGDGFIGKPKQPQKQAVHCKTQEEWDFAQKKLNRDSEWEEEYPCSIFGNASWKGGVKFCEKEGIQILSFQEWCDLNGYKMENEVKFEVGKWYKMNDCWYLKYKGKDIVATDKIYMSECIDSTFNHKYDNGFVAYLHEQKTWRLASIEEIQQYLPGGHPDKMKVNQEFKVGNYIVVLTPEKTDGCKLKSNSIHKLSEVSPYYLTVEVYRHNGGDIYQKDVRHATPEEINNHLISIGEIVSVDTAVGLDCGVTATPWDFSGISSCIADSGIAIHQGYFIPSVQPQRKISWTTVSKPTKDEVQLELMDIPKI